MKLIECYVNNFGKLADFSYSFKDGLNVIQEENGYGKSTFSAFIKSMLFGLEDTKRIGIFENDRKKYEPWQGGAWGGSLTISSGGEKYRIERSFNKKAALDEVKIYDLKTGKLTDKFSEKPIGEILLGIDREGFERTVFLSEREIDEKKGINNISAKLSRLTGVAFDMTELDSATKLLDEERQYYYKKGGSGAISDIAEKISELEYRKAELSALEAKHENDAKLISEKENEINELKILSKRELEMEKRTALREERLKEYRRKLSDADNFKEKRAEILSFFGGKIPEKETLYELRALKDEISSLNNDALRLQAEIDALPEAPTEAEIDSISLLSIKTNEKRKKCEEIEKEKLNTGATQAKKLKIFTTLGAIALASGIALSFISFTFLLITAFGAALLVHSISLSKKSCGLKLEDELGEIKAQIAENEERIADFYTKYSLPSYNHELAIFEARGIAKKKEKLLISLRDKKERLLAARERCGAVAETYPIINEYPSFELASKIDAYKFAASNEARILKECEDLKRSFDFSENADWKAEARVRASELLIEKRARTFAS